MKLLFVDPSKAYQQIVAATFPGGEIEIGFADTGAEALAMAGDGWQFVCTALHLPDDDGLSLCRKIRAMPAFQHTPLILFTADSSESLQQEAAKAGATEVFQKQNINELVAFVGRYTARLRKIGGRVLYVEDTVAQALAVQALLSGMGLDVEWSHSGIEAWEAFQTRHYDLVLTDLVLTDSLSGASLVSRIRSIAGERGDTPIIAVTAFDQLARRIELFHLGINDYVVKPIVEEELASRVRNLVERRNAEQALRWQEKRRLDEAATALSRMLNSPGSSLAATLKEICRHAAEALKVTRASIWLPIAEGSQLICRAFHEVGAPDNELKASRNRSDCPKYFEALESNRIVAIEDAWLNPVTAELRDSYLVPNDIRSLLDVPIGPRGNLQGVMCHEERARRRRWTPDEESFAAAAGDIVALAIESHQRWLTDRQLRLAGLVFEATAEAIIVCDAETRIITVNDAFTSITGYDASEAIGKTPSMLKSDRHDADFYAGMWSAINNEGKWLGEIWDRRKDGTIYPKRLSITRVLDEAGHVSHYIGAFTDISKEKSDQEQLRFLAYTDTITQLPNRAHAEAEVDTLLGEAAATSRRVAALCIDVDRFKKINASFGHGHGDLLLREVARRLAQTIPNAALLARWSGASFLVVMAGPDAPEQAIATAQRCIEAFRQAFPAGGSELSVTPSIGIALHPQHGGDAATLIKNAMTALGHAKDGGGNRFALFDNTMEQRTVDRLLLESRLRNAIDKRHFVLHYQPKVDSETRRIVGTEALVRWHDPVDGLIAPGMFLPLAEETGQIYTINDWVLGEACRQNAEWHDRHGLRLPVAVNLPAGAFARCDVVGDVRRALSNTGLQPELLELELTESAIIDDPQQAIDVLRELKALGIRLSIDDFGTGYSSLAYLRRLPVDTVKIDRSFVADINASDDELVIVTSIIALAGSLRLNTIAEGIEREAQAQVLRDLGCRQLQGFLFARPMEPSALLAMAQQADE